MSMLETKQSPPVNFSPLLRSYTLEEFWELPEPEDRAHYDLIGGILFLVPPPEPPHGDVDAGMNFSLVQFLVTHNIQGNVYHPRESVWLDGTYIEPDMMYVSHELRARMVERRTSADIVFEYLSPSTATYDRTTKADTYLALGVRELWLVDPETASIEVRNAALRDALPVWETRRSTAGEWAESKVLPGWRVSVDELFAGLV